MRRHRQPLGANLAWLAFTTALGIGPSAAAPIGSDALVAACVLVGAAAIGLVCAAGARRAPIGRVLTLQ